MYSVCRCSLPVSRRPGGLKKGNPVTNFCPTLDPPQGGSGRKTTTHVRDREYFIPTKFHQNPSSGYGEEVENAKVYGRRTDDDGRTDDGRCAKTIAHLSLRLKIEMTHETHLLSRKSLMIECFDRKCFVLKFLC